MTQKDYILNLLKNIESLDKAVSWLSRSYKICSEIGIKDNYKDEEMDAFEAMTSRFARVSDLIIQKIFRSIDHVEFETSGTLIDVINRAHKREFFDNVEEIRKIREIRNEIAHEYIQDSLKDNFEGVLEHTPELFILVDRIKDYCNRYKNESVSR